MSSRSTRRRRDTFAKWVLGNLIRAASCHAADGMAPFSTGPKGPSYRPKLFALRNTKSSSLGGREVPQLDLIIAFRTRRPISLISLRTQDWNQSRGRI